MSDQPNQNTKTKTPAPKNGVKKIRKARIQVAKRKNLNLQREEGGGDYNIWYHKYIGQNRERNKTAEPASTRCNIMKDSGWTVGCTLKDPHFCLYFARGSCDKGPECNFLHRLPTESDVNRIPITKDCFGRDKFANDRDDMGGVGTFSRDNRTIYISNLKNNEGVDLDEAVIRHFKEWGELEYVRVFPEKCCAFIKYKNRLCTEFCKEAMLNQALDGDEVIEIRWATDDPNPIAAKRNALELREKLIKKIESDGVSTTNLSFNYPKDYKPEETKLPEELEAVHQEYQEFQKQSTGEVDTPSNQTDATPTQEIPQRYQTAEELREQLEYGNYLQKSAIQTQVLLDSRRQQDQHIQEQRQVLNSNVADPYPNTEAQYNNNQMTQQQYDEYVKQYYENYYKFYGQLQNQLQGNK
ncbi:pre-mRNA-splicing factor cwc2 [Acrasis kona]|uniref:Pre-mRNA-splicing factor cwc2 n=1 Tax=Acrasis kona TaxID=1008807 RepID=A0AAW2ZF91_9EUKA